MACQMQTLLLVFAICMLAGVVQSAETLLTPNQKTESPTVGFESSSWEESNPTYTVQAGYEGYLVPAAESQSIKDIIKTVGIFGAIPILIKYVGQVALKVGVAVAVAVLLGLLVNYGLCKCTSLCPFDFNQGWDRRSFSVSQDQMQSAARLLATAVDKFGQIEQKSS